MCQKIITPTVEIETPKEFQEYFGFAPIVHEGYQESSDNDCLCACNSEQSLLDHNISFYKNEDDDIICS